MNGRQPFLAAGAWLAGSVSSRPSRRGRPRVLVIRRNRLGDMICTLPLLHALRRGWPGAHLAVACDPAGAPIASAGGVVDEIIVLRTGGIRILSLVRDARRLQGFDWVLAAKGGFDRRLAALARLSNGARRIGFAPPGNQARLYYTDPVPGPETEGEHQVDTLLRLLRPLGIAPPPENDAPTLEVPAAAAAFAARLFATPPLDAFRRFILINISSTAELGFSDGDFLELIRRLLEAEAGAALLVVAAPGDQARARALAARSGSPRVLAVATPGPLDLAAVMKKAALLVTPEGGAAHLAAAVGLAAVVLWSHGPFEKWHSRAENHVFVRADLRTRILSVDQVWQALEPVLAAGTKSS